MSDAQEQESPRFKDVVIFYNYVFDLGNFVDPIQTARKILNSDYAISLSNPITDTVELAAKFSESLKTRHNAQNLADLYLQQRSHGVKGVILWAIRHPKQALSLWKIYREDIQGKSTNSSSLPAKDSNENLPEVLTEAINSLDARMAQVQMIASLQTFSDKRLFSELYLDDLPFVRLELEPIYATINGEEQDFIVSLLIHRTGIAILSLYTQIKGELEVADLIELQTLSTVQVTKVTVHDALMATQAIAMGVVKPSLIKKAMARQKNTPSEQWNEMELPPEAPYTLRDIIDWYRMTIISTVLDKEPVKSEDFWNTLRTSDWFAYPIVFVEGISPSCETDQQFKKQYQGALAGLLMRFKKWREIKSEKIEEIIKGDLSLTHDKSVYITQSHGLVLYYSSHMNDLKQKFGENIPGHEWMFLHLQTSGLIDILLIQRWILHILDSEIRVLPYSLKRLNSLKRNLLLALSEYYDITVSYGSAKEIIEDGKKSLGIHESYEGIKTKLSNFEKLVEVQENIRRYRRDLFLRLVVTMGTLLFGLSGARQVISVISSWNRPVISENSSWLTRLFYSLVFYVEANPGTSTLILYLVLLALVIPAMIWSIWPARNKKPIISFGRSETASLTNFVWPVSMGFQKAEGKENHQTLEQLIKENDKPSVQRQATTKRKKQKNLRRDAHNIRKTGDNRK